MKEESLAKRLSVFKASAQEILKADSIATGFKTISIGLAIPCQVARQQSLTPFDQTIKIINKKDISFLGVHRLAYLQRFGESEEDCSCRRIPTPII